MQSELTSSASFNVSGQIYSLYNSRQWYTEYTTLLWLTAIKAKLSSWQKILYITRHSHIHYILLDCTVQAENNSAGM